MKARTRMEARIRTCRDCWLGSADHVTLPVPYRGPIPAPILVIGEAPGDVEDRAGKPFVGRAGNQLADLLRQARIDPDRFVGFCNVVSCFPGRKGKQFRSPAQAEVAACRHNLELQVALARPQVIVLAGATALNAIRPDLMVSKDRGRPLYLPEFGGAVAVPTYHPSATLRAKHLANPVRRDLQQVRWRWRVEKMGRWPTTCRLCDRDPREVGLQYDEHGVAWCDRHVPTGELGVKADALQLDLA